MRAVLVVSLVVLIAPAAALAQATPAPSTTVPPSVEPAPSPAARAPRSLPARSGDITRDQYIERAVERARRAAEKRFDKMDVNHDGVLSAEERRGARAERAQRRAAPSQ